MKKLILTSVILINLSACQAPYSSNNSDQYLQSRNGQNLVVPKPLTAENLSSFYNLPTPKVGVDEFTHPKKI